MSKCICKVSVTENEIITRIKYKIEYIILALPAEASLHICLSVLHLFFEPVIYCFVCSGPVCL